MVRHTLLIKRKLSQKTVYQPLGHSLKNVPCPKSITKVKTIYIFLIYNLERPFLVGTPKYGLIVCTTMF